ncbi:MAG: hypothetical protein ACLPHI_17770 [Terriglobales bacterium]
MRFSLAIAVVLAGLSVSALAQQSNEFKVKPSTEKQKKAAPLPTPKTAGAGTAASANSKELQAVEHQSAKTPHSAQATGKKTGPALKPVKDKPNPPINFNSSGAAKGTPGANSHSDPYKGRVRQKGAHQ